MFTRDIVRRELTIDHTFKYAFPDPEHGEYYPEVCRSANINASNRAVNDFVIGNKSIAAVENGRGISVHNVGAGKDMIADRPEIMTCLFCRSNTATLGSYMLLLMETITLMSFLSLLFAVTAYRSYAITSILPVRSQAVQIPHSCQRAQSPS